MKSGGVIQKDKKDNISGGLIRICYDEAVFNYNPEFELSWDRFGYHQKE